jgi:hypothetical protein
MESASKRHTRLTSLQVERAIAMAARGERRSRIVKKMNIGLAALKEAMKRPGVATRLKKERRLVALEKIIREAMGLRSKIASLETR